MHSLLYFDTEDSFSPPAFGSDDIVLWIADLLSRYQVKGSFHVIGDKARRLERRGRRDVIRAVSRHDVSSHFNRGSVHPATVEQVAAADWEAGVRITLQEEETGFRDIERIFGKCAALTRHGGSYAPQIIQAISRCGKVYYGAPFQLPEHRVFWFCGNLVFSILDLIVTESGDGPGYFEEDYAHDEAFNTRLVRLPSLLEETAQKWEFTALFGAHPHHLLSSEFSCKNHYGGFNRPEPQPLMPRPLAERERIRRNLERLVAALAQASGTVSICGLGDLAVIFGCQAQRVTADHLAQYARRVRESEDVPLDPWFSPAELLTALAEAVTGYGQSGRWPLEIRKTPVIGPTVIRKSDATAKGAFSWDDVKNLAAQLVRHVRTTGSLPAHLSVAETEVTLSGALGLLAEVYDDARGGRAGSRWTSKPRHPYPAFAGEWAQAAHGLKAWRVFDPALDFGNIEEFTRWQTWSVKPAHLSIPSELQ
ncbi:MAG: hypothetical protein HY360_15255 [Verrucomicrobia bacterium]|nr:hypothetical protein [Verrucomicrobiota bacterium]